MPLNILRHKSWHPGNLEARERVLRDEAKRDEELKALSARSAAADTELRVNALRRSAGFDVRGAQPGRKLDDDVSERSIVAARTARSGAAPVPAASELLGALVASTPWYSAACGAPSSSNVNPRSREPRGALEAAAARVRDDARKAAEDPLAQMMPKNLAGKRDRKEVEAHKPDAAAASSDASPDWQALRRARLAREAIHGARATRQLMDAAFNDDFRSHVHANTAGPSSASVALAAVAQPSVSWPGKPRGVFR